MVLLKGRVIMGITFKVSIYGLGLKYGVCGTFNGKSMVRLTNPDFSFHEASEIARSIQWQGIKVVGEDRGIKVGV